TVVTVIGHEPRERREQVALHIGVGILIDEDPRGRVRHGHDADPVLDAGLSDLIRHARGDVDGLRLLARLDPHAQMARAHARAAARDRRTASAPSGSTPMTRISRRRSFSASAVPPMRPPPPTGTTTVSTSGTSSRISRPIVPCPATMSGSAYGCTNVLPCSRS